MEKKYAYSLRSSIIIPFLLTLSCGQSIKSAQDFVPNKAPVKTNFTVEYVGTDTSYNPDRLYSGMPYLVTVDAYDPEGKPLTYDITSSQGTFSSQTVTETGVTCKFYIGAIAGGDAVSIKLAIIDAKKASYTQSIDVGTGKSGPGLTVTVPSSTVITPGGDTSMSFSCDSKGTYRVYGDITSTAAQLGTDNLTKYANENEEKTIVIAGPKSTKSGVTLVGTAKNRIWVVFEDNNSQTAVYGFDMYVEGNNPQVKMPTSPADGDTNISITPTISIMFSKAMNESTLTSSNIVISDSAGSAVAGTYAYNPAVYTETFVPSNALSYGAVYTIKVLSSVADTVGNLMLSDVSFGFTTAAKDMVPNTEFSPAAGTYVGAQDVCLKNSDPSVTILYTDKKNEVPTLTKNADGTFSKGNGTACAVGTVVKVNADTTLRAIAYKNYSTASGTAIAAYNIKTAAPVFSESDKNAATGALKLSMSCATAGAAIKYTIDGTDPSGTDGKTYNSGDTVSVNKNMTVRAISTRDDLTNSDETSRTYSVKTAAPSFSIATGSMLTSDTNLTLGCESGALIYYSITSDGSDPADPLISPLVYSWEIPLKGTSGAKITYRIRAIAVKDELYNSDVSEIMTYTVDFGSVGTITFSPLGGSGPFTSAQYVVITCATDGAAIRYTTDSSDPLTSSTSVSGTGSVAVYVRNSLTLKAAAVKGSMTPSSLSSAYVLNVPAPSVFLSQTSGTDTVTVNAIDVITDATLKASGASTASNTGVLTFSVSNGSSFTITASKSGWNQSVYTPTKYTVTFNGNGGTPSAGSKDVYSGTTVGVLPTAARNGYVFDGWYTDTSYTTLFTNSTSITASATVYTKWKLGLFNMINVPAGSFQRDSTSTNISYVSSFSIGQYEITRNQFATVMGSDPTLSAYTSGSMSDPVSNLSWFQALVFCNKLSIEEGLTPAYTISNSTNPSDWGSVPLLSDTTWDAVKCDFTANGYRLPTEMEWLWAMMGATSDKISADMVNGINTGGYKKYYAGSAVQSATTSLGSYAWYSGNSSSTTLPVGIKEPNELGIYDMSGNVWEMCWDWYYTSSSYMPAGTLTDYQSSNTGSTPRLILGGAVESDTSIFVFDRKGLYQSYEKTSSNYRGFRVVRSIRGIVGEWLFNGNANDTSVNTAAAGTVTGATLTADHKGVASQAYSIQSGGIISINAPAVRFGQKSTFSVSLWVNSTMNTMTSVFPFVFDQGSSDSQFHCSLYWMSGYTLLAQISKYDSGAAAVSRSVAPGTWNHVVLVYSAEILTLYVNGVSVGSASYNNSSWGTSSDPTGNLQFGGGASFAGSIDDVRIYNRILSATEIAALYAE